MDTQNLKQLLCELLSQVRNFKRVDFTTYSYRDMKLLAEPPTEWMMCARRIRNVAQSNFKKDSSILRAILDGYDRAIALKDKIIPAFEFAKTRLTEGLEQAIKVVEDDRYGELLDVSPTTHDTSIGDKIFIGHGRSTAWMELRDFLQDRLGLQWEEFNRESPAGKTTKERLEEMLNASCFAFLVMTAEDEHSNSTLHARENVIHEVGLFQGKLGFNKAIVLLEEGCQEFSNIHGLGQIRFPKGSIKASSEEIRRVLEREGILPRIKGRPFDE
jgi:predicted nucleotide-binding protein